MTEIEGRVMRGKHVTFSRYDTAVYLRNEQDIKVYLDVVLEDGDPLMIGVALDNIARSSTCEGCQNEQR